MKYEQLTKEFLEEEYVIKERSTISIAKEIGCNPETVRLKLKKYRLLRRPSRKIPIDLSGQKFGALYVECLEKHNGQTMCKCRCECGNVVYVKSGSLRIGNNTTCGCKVTQIGERNSRWKGKGKISGSWWANFTRTAKSRTCVKKSKFEITIDYVWELYQQQDGKCALSGVPIAFSDTNYSNNTTASLDRIDSNKGYIKGNVQWLHKDVNKMKSDMDQDSFLQLCKQVCECMT